MQAQDTPSGTVADVVALAATVGMAISEPKRVNAGDIPFVVIPDDHSVKKLEDTLLNPLRTRATVAINAADSFIAYINKHKTDATSLYGSMGDKPSFIAVIDDHVPAVAAWREHKATYACPLSPEWLTWTNPLHNAKAKTQVDFARFIEDNLLDIVDPSAAEVLAVSRTLEAKKSVSFSSGVRLDNGDVQFTFNEETKGTAGKGTIDIPERFGIAIPVFEGGDKYRIDARLRYRINDGGQLSMWYELERPHKVIEHATKEVWKAIAEGTGLPIINGNPFAS
jgi:uncharacterized protein YfdQ (DUF2303 family)